MHPRNFESNPAQFNRAIAEHHENAEQEQNPTLLELCQDLSNEIKLGCHTALRNILENSPNSAHIQNFLEKKDLLFPTIEIYEQKSQIKSRLQISYPGRAIDFVTGHPVLMNLRLPEHLFRFWNKEKLFLGQNWSDHYETMIRTIWDIAIDFADTHNLAIYRVNPLGEHDNKDYYYHWLIYPKNKFSDDDSSELF